MTDRDEDIGRGAGGSPPPEGQCAVCAGTGGTLVPCLACSGTGRAGRSAPSASWLSAWRWHGAAVGTDNGAITAGLRAQDERATVAAVLDANDVGPVCYVCEGHDVTLLGDRPLTHYDMTGQCRGQHPHAYWDAASANIDDITPAVQQLVTAVVDPAATWTPPSDAGPDNWAAYINPGLWRAMPVAAVALWTAGSSGQGIRAAMDWLSSGQLAHMVAYCRQLESRLGRGPLPLLGVATEVLQGPPLERQAAVHQSWQALVTLEEAIRAAPHAQRLDLRAWLAGSAILAVSLPAGASVAQRQTVVAMLVAARGMAGRNSLPEPGVIWHRVGAPHPRGDWLWTMQRPCLVLAAGGAGFTGWAVPEKWGARQPAWLLGSAADREVLEAASKRLGAAGVSPPSANQALLVHNGGPPVVLTSTAP
jgi:hypothetical protein